jgi:uncharacterized protein YjiS (DUF1127 family)
MSTMEMFGAAADERIPTIPGLAQDLRQIWVNFIARRQERRLMARLSRLDPHILRDMGFDPAAVYGALEGTWDEVHGDRFRGL